MARKPPRTLTRRAGRRPERRTVLVFCEGEQSEPDYVIALRSLPEVRDRAAVQIEVDPRQGGPAELVRPGRQTDRRRRARRDLVRVRRRMADQPSEYRAGRGRGAAARHPAGDLQPCFEVWLVLHVEEQTSFVNTADAERRSRRLDGRTGKRIDGGWYVARREKAIVRAEALAERHRRNEIRFPYDNPSSSMSDLVRSVAPTAERDGSREAVPLPPDPTASPG